MGKDDTRDQKEGKDEGPKTKQLLIKLEHWATEPKQSGRVRGSTAMVLAWNRAAYEQKNENSSIPQKQYIVGGHLN